MNRFICVIILSIVLLPQLVLSQQDDLEKKIEYKSNELEKVRDEIKKFKNELNKAVSKEKSSLEKLQETEKNLSLTLKLLNQLNREQKLKENEIQRTGKSITQMENDLNLLKGSFSQRLVNLYKQGDMSEWEYLLTAKSFNQAIYRYKYFRIISDINRRNSREIRYTIDKVAEKKKALVSEVRDQEKIIAEKKEFQKNLAEQKQDRAKSLSVARKNKQNLAEAIRQKEKAAQELSRLIANLEKEQKNRSKELERQRALSGVKTDNPFQQSQGKLGWPVQGEIISRFGVQKHPTLKTVTENSGIDIKAKQGAPIKTILDGVVTTITYIRGFGNTIIIDHGSGFYSVYSHIENVSVYENQYISKDTVIASVGDSGTLSGSMLHFEIWKNRTKLDPEKWLGNR
ncbi:MAG: peptidoglycan DD-metalloendopeptidase family protein [Candidatus Marinimicrobia bacterium]|nr:peptidoglycan DD-metalloendopeptidase family protein [Candidatus Neomarinimicrobiota bacterium]